MSPPSRSPSSLSEGHQLQIVKCIGFVGLWQIFIGFDLLRTLGIYSSPFFCVTNLDFETRVGTKRIFL